MKEKANLVEKIYSNGKLLHMYNHNGHLVEKCSSFGRVTKLDLDESGNVLNKITLYFKDNNKSRLVNNQYDEFNRIVSTKTYNYADSTIMTESKSSYIGDTDELCKITNIDYTKTNSAGNPTVTEFISSYEMITEVKSQYTIKIVYMETIIDGKLVHYDRGTVHKDRGLTVFKERFKDDILVSRISTTYNSNDDIVSVVNNSFNDITNSVIEEKTTYNGRLIESVNIKATFIDNVSGATITRSKLHIYKYSNPFELL